MAKIMVRFELAGPEGRKHLCTVEVVTVPRPGEKVQPEGTNTYEVVDVVHTPVIREWDAVLVVKPV